MNADRFDEDVLPPVVPEVVHVEETLHPAVDERLQADVRRPVHGHARSNDRPHVARLSGRHSEASRDLKRGLKVLSKASKADTIQSI